MWGALSTAWQISLEEAWAAFCAGTIAIGAVVTNPDGEVLARGRNQITDFGTGAGLVRGHELAHAELNTLLAFDRRRAAVGCTLYTTIEPCPLCLGAFYMSGIRSLAYAARDPYAGSTNLLGATPYLRHKRIQVQHHPNESLETLAGGLFMAQEFRRYGWEDTNFRRAWRAVIPAAVALGERLARSGLLVQLAAQGAPAQAMVDEAERV